MRCLAYIVLSLLAATPQKQGMAQDGPQAGATNHGAAAADLFQQPRVLRLHIEIAPADLARLRSAPREYVNATIREGNARPNQVSVHLKGAVGSFQPIDKQPSLTLSFDRPVASQRFHGLRKIHLNNSVEDPSYASEWLGSEIFRAAGVPAARASHALVQLNQRPLGLYVLKEGFTADFLALHFPDSRSRLYEPPTGNDVNEPLDQKAGPTDEDRSALDALARALAQENLDQRWQALPAVLDVERFLSFLALEVMLGHRDGYGLARNNFRLALDGASGRLVFLPHGMDQLFGRAPLSLNPHMNGLAARSLLETAAGREAYLRQFTNLLSTLFRPATLARRVDDLAMILLPALPAAEQGGFRDAVTALKERLATRHQAMRQQVEQLHAPPFSPEGTAILSAWEKFGEPAEGALREVVIKAGRKALLIEAGPNTTAAWRTTARLPAGRYRFEGRVRTAGIRPLGFGASQGATLRLWRPATARSTAAAFEATEEKLSLDFDLAANVEVQLGCELRASAGKAWFDLNSLRVIPLPP